jgi:hypothetical protein
MKKALAKTRKSAKRKGASKKRPKKPVDLGAIREQITNIVGNDAVSMVETTIEEVGKGHFQAMKCLFEMIGLYPAPGEDDPEAPMADSLAATLLQRLAPEEALPENAVTKDSGETAAVEGDAVK